MSDWKTLSSETVYETPWFTVRRDQALNHRGEETTFSVFALQHPSIKVVATDTEGRVFVQKNYRYPVNTVLWDIPSGGSDGEDPLVAAKRELLEEAGMESDNWTMLNHVQSEVGTSNIPGIVFWAKDARKVTEMRDDEEVITEQQFMAVPEIEQLILQGEIVDISVISSMYLFKLHKERTNV